MDEMEALALAAAAKKRRGSQQPKSFGQSLWENIVGSGEVDTPGERIGATINDMVQSAESGARRGFTALADAPGALFNFGGNQVVNAIEKTGVFPEAVTDSARDSFNASPFKGDTMWEGVNLLTNDSLEFQPRTTAGEFSQTVGEFLFAALMPGGQFVGHALAPGVASEAAGQFTEGMQFPDSMPLVGGQNVEPWARGGAAIAAPGAVNMARRAVTPNPADPSRIAAARNLSREGIRTTAGQKTGNRALQFREEGSRRTADIVADQGDEFTAAALRKINARDPSNISRPATRATPEVLRQAADDIGGMFDEVAEAVSIPPSQGLVKTLSGIHDDYAQLINKSQTAPIIRNTLDKVSDSLANGKPISGQQYTQWRSQLSSALTDNNAQTRNAAKSYIDALDDAAESALAAAGRPEIAQKYQAARSQWRDFLAIQDAATKAGADTAIGVLNPRQMRAAVTKGGGTTSYAQGRRDLGNLTRDANAVMQPLPSSGTTERAMAQQLFQGAQTGTAGGGLAYALTRDPQIAATAGAASMMAPAVANRAIGTPAIQQYFANQLITGRTNPVSPQLNSILGALLLQRQEQER